MKKILLLCLCATSVSLSFGMDSVTSVTEEAKPCYHDKMSAWGPYVDRHFDQLTATEKSAYENDLQELNTSAVERITAYDGEKDLFVGYTSSIGAVNDGTVEYLVRPFFFAPSIKELQEKRCCIGWNLDEPLAAYFRPAFGKIGSIYISDCTLTYAGNIENWAENFKSFLGSTGFIAFPAKDEAVFDASLTSRGFKRLGYNGPATQEDRLVRYDLKIEETL